MPCIGVYRLNVPATGTGNWVCGECRLANFKSDADPDAIAAYRSGILQGGMGT